MDGLHFLESAEKCFLPEEAAQKIRLSRITAFIYELHVASDAEKSKSVKSGAIHVSPTDSEVVRRGLSLKGDASRAVKGAHENFLTSHRARALTAPDINIAETITKPPRDDSYAAPINDFKLWGDTHPLVRVASDPRPDEDFDDEVIVFRPAFSRVISPSIPSTSNVLDEEERNGRISFDNRVKSSSSLASLSSADADPNNPRFPGLLTEASRRSFSEDFLARKTIAPPPGFSAAVSTPPGFESLNTGYPIHPAASYPIALSLNPVQDQYPSFEYGGSLNDKDIFQKLW